MGRGGALPRPSVTVSHPGELSWVAQEVWIVMKDGQVRHVDLIGTLIGRSWRHAREGCLQLESAGYLKRRTGRLWQSTDAAG